MKTCGVILTILFLLFASSFGGTLRFNFSKPSSFLTLRLRRREYEVKDASGDMMKITTSSPQAHQKIAHFHLTQAVNFVVFLSDLAKTSPTLFSQTVAFTKNRLMNPPPTPPPIA